MKFLAALAVPAAAAIVLLWPVTRFGFVYDDYHQVRPYPLQEVALSFTRSWDPTGIESPFYRPLTVAFQAARFEAFGLDAAAYHWLSVLMFGACAALFTWFLRRVARAWEPAVIGGVLFAVHPVFAYSATAWITNQMHLIELLLALSALLWWTVCRGRSLSWWLPLLALQAAIFLVKEDGVMLVPALLGVNLLFWFLVEPAQPTNQPTNQPTTFPTLAAVGVCARGPGRHCWPVPDTP